jgi:hypothetical protein
MEALSRKPPEYERTVSPKFRWYYHCVTFLRLQWSRFNRKHKSNVPLSWFLWVCFLEGVKTVMKHYGPEDVLAVRDDARAKDRKRK